MGALLTKVLKLEKAKRWAKKALRPKFTDEEIGTEIQVILAGWPDLLAWLYSEGPRPDPHRLAAFICETAGMTRPGPEYCYVADAKVILPPLRYDAWVLACSAILAQRFLDRGEEPPDAPGDFGGWFNRQMEADPVSKRLERIFHDVWNANDPDREAFTKRPLVGTLSDTPECGEDCLYHQRAATYGDGSPRERGWHHYPNEPDRWAQAVSVAEQLAAADQARAAEAGA